VDGEHWVEAETLVEEDGFEAAYARLWPEMVRIAHLLTGSQAIAEELTQDAFLGLYRAWDRVDNPAGYLRRSLVNGSNSQFRRDRRRLLHPGPQVEVVLPPDVDEVWQQLKQLGRQQRAVVVLRFYEDLSLAEIADVLGVSVGTVKSTLSRSLRRLKEVLA
jgi:RNA polymerase sigma-70 factor (sigma-E family)